ncbi:hypothetical protein NQ318_002391 [Aromia moschata]|uniref:Uncharacterized protein n=1 Tax=Aromia moschata TaxID=1265417 RepID=A0AAV8YFG5_9CUCU|nr:hypothetical protein NQ318_002391 [Aromia moschata]
MSTLERKEYQETKILRTVSPVCNTRSSNQNLSQFDSNLESNKKYLKDYLLEDLQNSVSRPGSSLGQNTNTYRETSRSVNTLDSGVRSNSLNRITNVKSSNPVTEYSSDDAYNYASPDGRERVSGYKKEKYMYKSSVAERDILPEKTRMQNSINQLDSLLDDLQQVKKIYSYRKSNSFSGKSYNTTGSDPTFQISASKKTVNRELQYGDTPSSTSRGRTIERTEREGSLRRDLQYTNEGTYGDLRPLRTTSPSPSSRTSTLSKTAVVKNIHEYPVEVIETVAPDIDPEVLAHLDPNLRPPGNTKVTTTIKTYTYEIPGSGDYPVNLTTNTSDTDKYVYSPNQTITTPSKSFVYSKTENKENTVHQREPDWCSSLNKHYKESVTDNVTTNYTNYPPYQKPPPPVGPELNPPSSQQTYVYKENTLTKDIRENGYPQPPPTQNTQGGYPAGSPPYPDGRGYPPGRETYILKETHNTTINKTEPPFSERGYPIGNPPADDRANPPHTTYIFKETHNTTNKTVGPPYQNGYPPHGPNRPKSPGDVETFDPRHPPYGQKPNEPIDVRYSYKSTNTTQNTYKGGYPPSDETQTLLPKKFPTNDGPDGPPKKLDDLMATIGNEPPNSPLNAGFNAHEQELAQQKKIDTLKKQSSEVEDAQKKEPVSRTKNVSGPPVYYPPGHEMFAKKEEGEAAWRAQHNSLQNIFTEVMQKHQANTNMKLKVRVNPKAVVELQ